MARRELARRGGPGTLSVTTLLHEAYLNMPSRDDAQFPDRARFMGNAARVMCGLIIDHARNRQAQKRGRQFEITSSRVRTSATPPMKIRPTSSELPKFEGPGCQSWRPGPFCPSSQLDEITLILIDVLSPK